MSAPSVLEKAGMAADQLIEQAGPIYGFSGVAVARAVLMALLVDVETSLGSPYSADDAIGPVLRSILAEKPE